MEKENKEIPFGAKDSELYKFEYTIPEGSRARIEGNKVIIEKLESEDERIRQMIRNTLRDAVLSERISETSYREMSAYLEKTKPAEWSEEDKEMLFFLNEFMDNKGKDYFSTLVYPKIKIWLKSLHERFNLEPKQEWSEKDEDMLKSIIATCQLAAQDRNSGPARHLLEMQEKFLKSLHPQLKHCGNTYYDIIHNILDSLKDMDFMKITPEHRVSLLNDIRVKCKDADECAAILDEPHWKPSKKQIDALNSIILTGSFTYVGQTQDLISLKDGLQKLL